MADAMHTPDTPAIISRDEAKARGLRYYFTGKPCRNSGHIAERYVVTANCVACVRKPPRIIDPLAKKCSVEGCEKDKDAKGFCPKHYQMWKIYGDPLTEPKFIKGAGARWLEERIDYSSDECLIWPFGSNSKKTGYGQSYLNGERIGAHVHMAILAFGDRRSEGLIVAHTCGKGHDACCNPRHLRWSTHKENTADMLTHGTLRFGSSHSQTKLTEDDVRQIRSLNGVIPGRQIAKKFGVGGTTIKRIQTRQTWRHVD